MMEIVLNENQWVEDVIQNASLGNKPSETLGRLARYYRGLGYKKHEIEKKLEEFLIRCDPSINVVRWQPLIESSIKYSQGRRLINIQQVSITRNELTRIGELPGLLLQRLMFTLLCLAKYGNAVNPNNNSWVNRDTRDILALANIKITAKRQSLLFNDLWTTGYVGFSNIVDNINVNVKIVDEDDADVAIRVDDFRNLGNQYMKHIGERYIVCKNCGVVVKNNSHRQKYCRECATDINIQKTLENRTSDTV